jgi:hypothetical protein
MFWGRLIGIAADQTTGPRRHHCIERETRNQASYRLDCSIALPVLAAAVCCSRDHTPAPFLVRNDPFNGSQGQLDGVCVQRLVLVVELEAEGRTEAGFCWRIEL